jgi:hypothetical protein
MLTIVSSSLFLFSGYQFYKVSHLFFTFYILQYLLLALFITSTIHHYNNAEINYKYGPIIKSIDKTLSHTIGTISLFLSLYYKKLLPFICLSYVISIYYLLLRDKPLQPCLHCSIHVISNLGLVIFLIEYL